MLNGYFMTLIDEAWIFRASLLEASALLPLLILKPRPSFDLNPLQYCTSTQELRSM